MTIATSTDYEIWDVETGNLIGYHDDEAAALAAIRAGLDADGPDVWDSVVLCRVEPDGERVAVLKGAALLIRALTEAGGTFSVDGRSFDSKQIALGILLLAVLGSPEFTEAMSGLRRALSPGEAQPDLDRVRAAVGKVSDATGVPVRVEDRGATLTLVTPHKPVANLLALGVPGDTDLTPTPVRTVEDGYAVDIAA